ncbi:MAG: hypothetical protein J07HX64_02325 [halophilic archaeon J07HX64]|nr:MAG: hypothetical protein J07HX64_02325 [halophilic archaeon J07HX64]
MTPGGTGRRTLQVVRGVAASNGLDALAQRDPELVNIHETAVDETGNEALSGTTFSVVIGSEIQTPLRRR